jgi:hypothetical protein
MRCALGVRACLVPSAWAILRLYASGPVGYLTAVWCVWLLHSWHVCATDTLIGMQLPVLARTPKSGPYVIFTRHSNSSWNFPVFIRNQQLLRIFTGSGRSSPVDRVPAAWYGAGAARGTRRTVGGRGSTGTQTVDTWIGTRPESEAEGSYKMSM